MDKVRQLGVSWENDSLYFVESLEASPEKIFHIPFQERAQTPTIKGELDAWENELVKKIKNTLKEQKVFSTEINLSLPTSDIIFRSFVIPWMQEHEAKNVVEFEAGKYIPFSLEELSYSYHPITITENEKKCINIIFVAIRNDTLANYTRIFEATSLSLNIIEPSALSLIRSLSFKKLIPENQTIALIEKGDTGKIIISDKNTPQFVREFDLSATASKQGSSDPEDAAKKLTKEVRISLDYFNRQNEQLNVEKIFFLSSSDIGDLSKNLENYIGIPVVAIENSSVLNSTSQLEVGALNAYGASLAPLVSSLASFNFSKQKPESLKKSQISFKNISTHQSLIVIAFICVPLIIGSIIMSIFWPYQVKKEIASLNQKLGSFQGTDISFIEQKEALVKKKLTTFRQTRIKSDTALLLLLIPDLLPDGMWLKTLDISHYDTVEFKKTSRTRRNVTRVYKTSKNEAKPTLVVAMDGYAFSFNKGEQFRLVNTLLGKLKNSKEFSKFFQSIEIKTTSTQKLNEHDVTYFEIVCKQANENI